MHDRRIDGTPHVFGNEGALFKNAMTWWDHETQSIWSQPWGAAIDGPLEGTRLTLVPFDLVPWSVWRDRHPTTRVLVDERADLSFNGQIPHDRFVIGVALGEDAKGFHFLSAAGARAVNDHVGEFPVVVFADPDTREVDVFIRRPQGERAGDTDELTFVVSDTGEVTDNETGSVWDLRLGAAIDGPLRGAILQRAPFISSFDWAWRDFYPNTEFWGSRDG